MINNTGELDENYLFDDEQDNNGGNGGQGNANQQLGSRTMQQPNIGKQTPIDEGSNGPASQKTATEDDNKRILEKLNEGFGVVGGQGGNNGQGNGDNNANNNANLSVTDEDDFVYAMLKQNGINPNAISVTSEDGSEQMVSFSDLSRQEQIDLMQSISGQNGYQLDDDEVDIINAIRRTGMSVGEWADSFRQRSIEEYLQNEGSGQEYSIDSMTDDELWLADYKQKVKNATEQDALNALEYAKSNSELFEKTMEGMRQMYKENEENSRTQDMQRQQELAKQRAEQFEQAIVNAVDSNSKLRFGDTNLELSNQDKEDIASFILDRDASGQNFMLGAMQDQNELVKMAFFYLKGEELINEMQNSFKREMNAKVNSAYNKGYNDAKSGKGQSYVVQRPGINKTGSVQKIATLGSEDAML